MRRRKHTPLSNYLNENGITAPALAAELKVSRAAVYAWASGAGRPTLRHAIELVKIANGKLTLQDLLADPVQEGDDGFLHVVLMQPVIRRSEEVKNDHDPA